MPTDGKTHRLGKLGKFYSVTAAGSSGAVINIKTAPWRSSVGGTSTGKHLQRPDTGHYVDAKPTGWVYLEYGDDYVGHLMSETFPRQASIRTNPAGFRRSRLDHEGHGTVAYGASDDNETDPAEAMYMSWSDPGNFHTPNPVRPGDDCPDL